jgi:hypothetical protein
MFTCNFDIEADEGLWDWTYNSYLYDTNGAQIAQRNSWIANKPGMTGYVAATLTDPPPGQYHSTIEWWVEDYDLGTRNAYKDFQTQTPTSLSIYSPLSDVCGSPPTCQPPGCTGGCQAYYYKQRLYQVMDAQQPSQPIQKVMTMDESFTTPQNTCGATFASGPATTHSIGVFTDQFFFYGNSSCDGGGSCSVQRNQTWKEHASGNTVGTYTLTYTCSTFSIQ